MAVTRPFGPTFRAEYKVLARCVDAADTDDRIAEACGRIDQALDAKVASQDGHPRRQVEGELDLQSMKRHSLRGKALDKKAGALEPQWGHWLAG